ncbi:MAG: DUF5719 family protein [Terrimesophilobacter sp.]
MTEPVDNRPDAADAVAKGSVEPDADATGSIEPDPVVTGSIKPSPTAKGFIEPEPVAADAKPRRIRSARGVLIIGARIATGTVGIAVALATVAAAGLLPLPTLSGTPLVTSVVPVPADQQRVCAGPILRLGSDTGEDATKVSSMGIPDVVSASSVGDVSQSALSSTDNTTGVAPEMLTLPAKAIVPGTVPLLAGGQTEWVSRGDFTGFAAAECREASADTWLVGGATTTGRTTLLTMSNPGSVIATVTATIYTENGHITAAGTDGIVVPPGGQRILSLAGFAPGAGSPVVRVQSTGSQIVANFQQSVVRTLMPGGVDVIGATAAPATTVVIPGIVLSTTDAVESQSNQPDFEDLAPILRFLVPGTRQANAVISIVPENGTAKAAVSKMTLDPGRVTELSLGGFGEGSYTITITSDVPLVTGARTSRFVGDSATGHTDFAWFAAAQTVKKQALVAVADGPSPMLHLANTGTADAVVTLTQEGGSAGAISPVTIPAGRAVAVSVQARGSYEVSGFASLMVSVSYGGGGGLAAYTVSPTGPAAQPIDVYR